MIISVAFVVPCSTPIYAMQSSIDHNFYWQGWDHDWNARCRVRIFCPHPEQIIVVLTDLANLSTVPIRDAAPQIVPLIVKDYYLDPFLVMWVEQHPDKRQDYPEAEFWELQLLWLGEKIVEAAWTPVDRSQIEAFVGQEL